MVETTISSQIAIDRQKTREAMSNTVQAGVSLLSETHLVQEGLIDESDVIATTRFLHEGLAPITVGNYRLVAHSETTGEVAKQITLKLQELFPDTYASYNPYELQVGSLLHDIGKNPTKFKYHRDEVATLSILKQIGVKEELEESMPLTANDFFRRFPREGLGEDEVFNLLVQDDVLTKKGIATIADICGKRLVTGWSIQPFDEVIEYHFASRGNLERNKKNSLYPSGRILTEQGIELSGRIYQRLYEWLQQKGVDIPAIQNQIMAEEAAQPLQAVIVRTGTDMFVQRIHGSTFTSTRDSIQHISLTDLGVTEPDMAAFGCASVILGLPPQASVVIDNEEKSLEQAAAVRMRTVHAPIWNS